MTTARRARDLNHIGHRGILFHRKMMVSQFLDEATRWTVGELLASRSGIDLVDTVMAVWVRHVGPMQVLIADGERG